MKIASTKLCLLAATTTPFFVSGQETIPDLAAGVSDVSTLVGLLSDADLVGTLSTPGPFTVFAPVNTAFTDVDAAVLTCIAENPEWLTGVLTYHVVSGEFTADDVVGLTGPTNFTTVQGDDIGIDPAALTINGDVGIICPDALDASNGVVHLINGVLVPPSLLPDIVACATAPEDPTDTEEETPDEEETGGGMIGSMLPTIPEAASEVTAVSTLVSLLVKSDLVGTLSTSGPFTVFAPVDAAFADVDATPACTVLLSVFCCTR